MGLDMYAYCANAEDVVNPSETVNLEIREGATVVEYYYWRKFNHLHGWMHDLYTAKGGKGEFNCDSVVLTEEDLDALESAASNGQLKSTSGFFFGNDKLYPEDFESVFEFIEMSRAFIKDGKVVYYTSWW